MKFVPVVTFDQKTLMPTTPSRARRWIKEGKATGFWKRGIYCVRLNRPPSDTQVQQIAVGIDPGSKKEGFTVKSAAHTFLNIQADAVTWVKKAVEIRKMMREFRRSRKTPYRRCRSNRSCKGVPPSTRARWQWKIRICNWLLKMFPISDFVIENIKARPRKGKNQWNASFSPLEVGKNWFYDQISLFGNLHLRMGWDTKMMRDALKLGKTGNKMAETFEAHCVDSWVLANDVTGGFGAVDNRQMLLLRPLQFHRRMLHAMIPKIGGVRRCYGGTMSKGFKRGSLVTHPKLGLVIVGGTSKGKISLHDCRSNQRLGQGFRPVDCSKLAYNVWVVK